MDREWMREQKTERDGLGKVFFMWNVQREKVNESGCVGFRGPPEAVVACIRLQDNTQSNC